MRGKGPLSEPARSPGACSRSVWIAAGAGILGVAFGLPEGLAPPSPRSPIDGTTLARLALGSSGLIAIALGVTGWTFPRLPPVARLRLPPPEGREARRPHLWLCAVTLLAAALRSHGLDASLWVDEILTVEAATRPLAQVFTAPTSLNNHLLHTLLVRAVTGIAGEHEWAIRLPTVMFGIATVPAVYALARHALRTREALLAALLLAVSYHHVFYSQNSRGYTAFVFWTVIAMWLLLRALTEDRSRDWGGFAAASFLAGASMLLGGFVLVGQAALVPLVAARVRRAGGDPLPIATKALAVIALVGVILLDLYALALPGLYGQVAVPSLVQTEGPGGFVYELVRGLAPGSGPLLIAALLIIGGGLTPGLVRFVRRHPVTCALLVAPLATLGAAVLLIGLYAMPRYFLWAIVPYSLGLVGSAAAWPRRIDWLAPGSVALVAAVSLAGLRGYYAVPFQASRESVDWVLRESAVDDVVVPLVAARAPVRHYGPRRGLSRARIVRPASTVAELRSIERAYAGRRLWLLTTHRLQTIVDGARLAEHIGHCYRRVAEFPAKVHRMEISVWTGRPCEPADE